MSDGPALVADAPGQLLHWNGPPETLHILRDDAIIESPWLDVELGLGGSSQSLVGQVELELGHDVVLARLLRVDRQTVRHAQALVRAGLLGGGQSGVIAEGKEVERSLRETNASSTTASVAKEVAQGLLGGLGRGQLEVELGRVGVRDCKVG